MVECVLLVAPLNMMYERVLYAVFCLNLDRLNRFKAVSLGVLSGSLRLTYTDSIDSNKYIGFLFYS